VIQGGGCPGGPDPSFEIHSSCYSGLLDIYSFGLHNLYLKNEMISLNVWTSRFFLSLKFCILKKGNNILEFLHSQLLSIFLKYYLVQVVFCIFKCCPEYKCSIYGQQCVCVLYISFFIFVLVLINYHHLYVYIPFSADQKKILTVIGTCADVEEGLPSCNLQLGLSNTRQSN
jgi:hypothetical protein